MEVNAALIVKLVSCMLFSVFPTSEREKDGLFYKQLYKISFYSYIFFFIYFLRFKKYVAISSLDRFNAVQAHPVVFLWKEKKNSNRYGRFCNFIPNILIIITYRFQKSYCQIAI